MKDRHFEKLKNLLIHSKNIQKDAVVWNALSACLNSFQTMLLLLVLTHFGTDSDSGVFVMAYAVGNLMLNIGRFGMRQYQVTDVSEKFSYGEYVRSRFFSCGLMLVCSALYILWGIVGKEYTAEKTIVVSLVILMKGIEAAEDVMHGRIQQKGRLDIAAKILATRFSTFIFGFAICFILTRRLLFTAALNVAITGALCIVLNGAVIGAFSDEKERKTEKRFPWALIWDCLPLGLAMVTHMYLTNAPKYVIDGILSDEAQTAFNIIMMPAFVVTLLSNFIFNPVLKRMGSLWVNHQIRELRRLVRKLFFVPIGVDVVAVLGGYYLGPTVFNIIYGVDVRPYTGELVVFLIASGAVAVLNLFIALLTTMRKQRHLLYCYSAGCLAMLIAGKSILLHDGLMALCWLYLAVLVAVAAYCAVVYLITVRGGGRAKDALERV